MIREARSGEETSANPRVYTERFPRSCVEPVKTSLSNSIKFKSSSQKTVEKIILSITLFYGYNSCLTYLYDTNHLIWTVVTMD